jgi:hypothetical protein
MTKDRWLATAVALLTAALIGTAILLFTHKHQPNVRSSAFESNWTPIATCDYRQTSMGEVIEFLQKSGIDARMPGGGRMDPIWVPARQASEAQRLLRGKNYAGLRLQDPLPEPQELPYYRMQHN